MINKFTLTTVAAWVFFGGFMLWGKISVGEFFVLMTLISIMENTETK